MNKDALDQSTNQGQSGETLDKSLLVVDDDKVFCERLARAMSARGFTARTAMSVGEALAAIETARLRSRSSTSDWATAAASTSCGP